MSLSGEELYNEIFAKVNGSEFDAEEMPDMFMISVFDGEEEMASWDITEDIKEQGMSRVNYTDEDHDINIIFMHHDFQDLLKDDKLFQQAIEMNQFLESNGNVSSNITYHVTDEKMSYLPFGQGLLILLIGLVGLAIRLKISSKSCPSVVKVTRSVTSVWCIITGSLLLVYEGTRPYQDIGSLGKKLPLARILTFMISEVLLKSFMVSLKAFTLIVYIFQNTMIYRPFFFRQHKKVISRWVLRTSLGQSAVIVPALVAWSMSLVFYFNDGDCIEIMERSKVWKITIHTSIVGGYVGSLILSFVFTLGYYQKNTKKVGSSERKSIKKTLIACTMEILFDASALVAKLTGHFQCLNVSSRKYGWEDQITYTPHCDLTIRAAALDKGLSWCLIYVLVLQPAVQEVFLSIAEIVEYYSR